MILVVIGEVALLLLVRLHRAEVLHRAAPSASPIPVPPIRLVLTAGEAIRIFAGELIARSDDWARLRRNLDHREVRVDREIVIVGSLCRGAHAPRRAPHPEEDLVQEINWRGVSEDLLACALPQRRRGIGS